jgi:hypothetical protein
MEKNPPGGREEPVRAVSPFRSKRGNQPEKLCFRKSAVYSEFIGQSSKFRGSDWLDTKVEVLIGQAPK